MKAIVTGGKGFIGSHLVSALEARGDTTVVVDLPECDIRDPEALAAACAGADTIFHLAAIASVQQSIEDPVGTHTTNVVGLLNVLEAARHAKVKKVVFASSAAVYGSAAPTPTLESAPLAPESPYGMHKLMGEQYMALYRTLHSIDTTSLRFFNVYGPGQKGDSPYSGVVAKFLELARAGGQPTIFGDGSTVRDFVHVRDVVAAILAAAQSSAPGPINVGTGKGVTIVELAQAVWSAAGKEAMPVFLPAQEGDIKVSTAAVGLAKEVLGWSASVPLSQGIKEFFV